MVKLIVGILLIVLGVALGLYVGVWLMFISGIIGLIEAIKILVQTGDVNSMLIAINIAKILLSSLAGYVSAILFIIPGQMMVEES